MWLNSRQMAAAIGYSWEYFRKAWPALVADAGMPPPRPRVKSGALLWDSEAVHVWLHPEPESAQTRMTDGQRLAIAARFVRPAGKHQGSDDEV